MNFTSSSPDIHFIIGPGRSGTTLLLHMLNEHPNCIATPETKHLLYFYNKYKHITVVTEALIKDVNHYIETVFKSDIMYYNVPVPDFANSVKTGSPISYLELSKKIYLLFTFNNTKITQLTTIIDKNPLYSIKTEEILRLLPQARFLCLIRDYRDFVLSNFQSKGELVKRLSPVYHALVWRFYAKELIKAHTKHQAHIKITYYEELVKEKEKEFREICTFFNIPYNEQCFDFNKTIQEKVAKVDLSQTTNERVIKKIESLSKPVNKSRVNPWKEAFNKEQVKNIEFWCAASGNYFNYLPTEKISFSNKIKYIITGLPSYLRVWLFFQLKSVKLTFYLNDKRKSKRYPNFFD